MLVSLESGGSWSGILVMNGGRAGAGREADRKDDIFPLEIIYTVQKSGAPLDTLFATSVFLNLL